MFFTYSHSIPWISLGFAYFNWCPIISHCVHDLNVNSCSSIDFSSLHLMLLDFIDVKRCLHISKACYWFHYISVVLLNMCMCLTDMWWYLVIIMIWLLFVLVFLLMSWLSYSCCMSLKCCGETTLGSGETPLGSGETPLGSGETPWEAGRPPWEAGRPPWEAGRPYKIKLLTNPNKTIKNYEIESETNFCNKINHKYTKQPETLKI